MEDRTEAQAALANVPASAVQEVVVTSNTQIVVLDHDQTVAATVDSGDMKPQRVDSFVVRGDTVYIRSRGGGYLYECSMGRCWYWFGPSSTVRNFPRRAAALAGYGTQGLTIGATECEFHGAITVADAESRWSPVTLLGRVDAPLLTGPAFPLRVAADVSVGVIEGPYLPSESGASTVRYGERSGLQRWSTAGELLDSRALCCDGGPDVDVRAGAQYVAWGKLHDVGHVQKLTDEPLRVWSKSRITGPGPWRVGAADDVVGVLGVGAKRIELFSAADGRERGFHDLTKLGSSSLIIDLALDASSVYLADVARQRIVVLQRKGVVRHEFDLHDPPRAMAIGGGSRLFVLGANGWVLRYSPDGALEAQWHLPPEWNSERLEATDIAVTSDGDVLVPFVGMHTRGDDLGTRLESSGVWVFRQSTGSSPPPAPPDNAGCLVDASKDAVPKSLALGDTTSVTTYVEATCPGGAGPHQVMFVVDSSGSMAKENAIWRARRWTAAAAAMVRPGKGQLGLANFSDSASLLVPLSDDIGAVVGEMARIVPVGDTFLAEGIEAARRELSGVRGKPGALRSIVIVTDGAFHDEPKDAIQAVRDDGILIRAMVFPSEEPYETLAPLLHELFQPDELQRDPMPGDLDQVMDPLRGWTTPKEVLALLTIDDEIPENMELVPGSSAPEPSISDRRLRWQIDSVAAGTTVSVSYRLRPLEAGRHPVSVGATARYTDGLGVTGELGIRIPVVDVRRLPTATHQATATATLEPTPTPRPSNSPTLTASATGTVGASATASIVASETPTPLASTTSTASATAVPSVTLTPDYVFHVHLPFAARNTCDEKRRYADWVLVIDTSTSMLRATSTGRSKLTAVQEAARAFVSLLALSPDGRGEHDQVGIVGFNGMVWRALPLMAGSEQAAVALEQLEGRVAGGSRLDLAIEEATAMLASSKLRASNEQVMVVLTDGMLHLVPTPAPSGTDAQTVLGVAEEARERGIRVYTIGVGEHDASDPAGGINAQLLRSVASDPHHFFETPSAEDLERIYAGIAKRYGCPPAAAVDIGGATAGGDDGAQAEQPRDRVAPEQAGLTCAATRRP